MKKSLLACFVLAFCFSISAFAQLGFRAGVNLANQNYEIDGSSVSLEPDARIGLVLGAFYEVPVSDAFSIQPELLFIQKGYQLEFDDFMGGTEEQKVRLNHIDVPINAKYKFGGTESLGGYVLAGPTLGYAVAGSTEINDDRETFDDEDWEGYNRFELGAGIGGGVTYNSVSLDVRYTFSLNNLSDQEDFTVRNTGIMITLGYQL